MNTPQIKSFAIQSRNILKTGVIQRIQILGFDASGNLTKGEPTRIEIQGGATLFAGEIYDGAFYNRWMSLRERIREKGVKEVYEEAAYTWFNRLVAIRILQKNGFIDPVLAYTNEQTRIPRIVAEARAGRIGRMSPGDREKLRDLLRDDARINEQFALLIDNFCCNNSVIFNCFGGIEEYISLLLPDNILAPGGFIDLLNQTNYITDEDFKQSELIGWLYQFYISEKKDEVFDGFKKGKKAEAEDIPAATQIFTPNWIVKYMVQNTIGRIYLDNNPWATGIKESMKYLVEPAEPTPKDAILKLESLEDYKLLDNACGSGHILVEAFGLFYKMYLEEGYSSHNAIENILRKNLLGIDLDTRAKQLATFALLMTAAKVDPSFLDCQVMPRVLDMPGHTFSRPLYELLREFFMGEDRTVIEETMKAFELLEQAENLGSIMKFNLSTKSRKEMALRYKEWRAIVNEDSYNNHCPQSFVSEIIPSIAIILALTDEYSAVVTNPPYMGAANMGGQLYSYICHEYEDGKADFCTTFMLVQARLTTSKGIFANIVPPSWMFLATFERLRCQFLDNYSITSLLHLSRGVFGADFGSASCTIRKYQDENARGTYFRLIERTFQEFDQKHLRDLFRLTLENSDFKYKFSEYSKDIESIEYSPNGARILYENIFQSRFFKIPGTPIGYWVSDTIIDILALPNIASRASVIAGLCTGDNSHYIFYWFEPNVGRILFPNEQFQDKAFKFHNKGGDVRKWYGNQNLVVKYSAESMPHLLKLAGFRNDGCDYFYRESISWAKIASSYNTFRYYPKGFVFDSAGSSIFENRPASMTLLAFCNSIVARAIVKIINPTINASPGIIKKLPYPEDNQTIISIVKECIEVSKFDFDAHETSWDFKTNELVRLYKENNGEGLFVDANRLEEIVALYKEYWTEQFKHLHANEEELNRQFIEIYGLQDELSPDIPLDEITILQQGEISVEDGSIVWHNDVLTKQLLSYVIGCIMGRYRLDRPSLHIAYPNPTSDDIAPYNFQGESFEIDDDGIIPLLGRDCPFDDNAYNRVVKFIRQAFGESFLNENLNFIEASLGRTIEDYFVKDFWKDHKKMYSNRPIYWLFSSKKGAFQCLTYMHRMNPYTAEAVRSKYLLPYIDFLKNKIAADMERASSLSTVERRNLDKMQKALDECLEYEEVLHDVADRQIRFDLDDGVVVNYAKFGDVLAKIK